MMWRPRNHIKITRSGFSITVGAPRDIDPPMAISVATLTGFARMSNHSACNSAGGTANDSTLYGIASHGSADCRSAESANCGPLFRARTSSKGN